MLLVRDEALLLDCILLFPSAQHVPDIRGLSLWVEMLQMIGFIVFVGLISLQSGKKIYAVLAEGKAGISLF